MLLLQGFLEKQEVIGLVGNLLGDKVALIALAGQSLVHCPLTNDYSAIKMFLDDLSIGIVLNLALILLQL